LLLSHDSNLQPPGVRAPAGRNYHVHTSADEEDGVAVSQRPVSQPEARQSGLESAAYRSALQVIRDVEPRVADAIVAELADQRASLKLIASENYASPAVLLAMGNWFSDKYAEGTIGRRFYAGCKNVDTIEALAAEHARELFGAPHAYVQPHSGIDANLVAFWAVLTQRVERPALDRLTKRHINDLDDQQWAELRADLGNQRLLGMSLDAGGHLTHGFRPNISGKMFDQRSYGTDPVTGLLDYDALREQAREFRPLIIIGGYSAYPRLVNFATLREIADEVDATLMVDMAHFAGLVAGRVLTGDFDPVPHAHLTTTTTHKSLRGPRGGMVLCGDDLAEYVDRGCPAVLGGPLSHVIAAKAVALAEARTPDFQDYARRIVVNAKALADGLLRHGVTLVTGGTDNHIVLLDVSAAGLTGRQAESALLQSGIVTNRNSIPRDPNGAWFTSGVRLGTPALTTRGLGPAEMDVIADLIATVLEETSPGTTSDGKPGKVKYQLDEKVADRVARQAEELVSGFPLYPGVDLS
jgi:glycine hydroxymethyltransferase